jgi:tRNA (guanine-N7-)-methyltransferase
MGRRYTEYETIALRSEDFDGRVDFVQIFGREAPLHIEIGSGKGTFLVHQARAEAGVNFVGIEWSRKYYRHAVDRIGRWGLDNVRLVRADAVTFLRDFVHEASVACCHVYFPDPWPKKRHHKRRFLQQANLDIVVSRLVPGGEIRIATDHPEYFAQIEEVTAAYRTKLEPIPFVRPAGAQQGEWTGTNYERKYIKDGRPIFALALRRYR